MKSKKTITAEREVAELQARLAKARMALDDAFEHDADGERIPGLSATVELIARRIGAAETALHKCKVGDCLEAITAAKADHSKACQVFHAGKHKHLADCIAAAAKPSAGRTLGKTRKLWPKWLTDLQLARHDTHGRLCERYEDLRSLDPAEARRVGWVRLEDGPLPQVVSGRIEV